MASHIVLHNLSSCIRMEDNRWIVTGVLIAFPPLVSQRLGEETGEQVERQTGSKKERLLFVPLVYTYSFSSTSCFPTCSVSASSSCVSPSTQRLASQIHLSYISFMLFCL